MLSTFCALAKSPILKMPTVSKIDFKSRYFTSQRYQMPLQGWQMSVKIWGMFVLMLNVKRWMLNGI